MSDVCVSVIIPCYNQARYLADAVASIRAQTHADWECLIVNDGSPDNCREVASGLVAGIPWVNSSIYRVFMKSLLPRD